MKVYQKRFLDEALSVGALSFGDFTLKSGRKSPYFFNAGKFSDGRSIGVMAECYSAALEEMFPECDLLFGPAYKGIPLVTATAIKLSEAINKEVPFCFNRKEAKGHGEGGSLVGAPLKGRVVIVDDVITAGTAIREVISLLASVEGCHIVGCLVALDRQEKGNSGKSAIQELADSHGIKVKSLISLNDLVDFVGVSASLDRYLPKIEAYRNQFGV